MRYQLHSQVALQSICNARCTPLIVVQDGAARTIQPFVIELGMWKKTVRRPRYCKMEIWDVTPRSG